MLTQPFLTPLNLSPLPIPHISMPQSLTCRFYFYTSFINPSILTPRPLPHFIHKLTCSYRTSSSPTYCTSPWLTWSRLVSLSSLQHTSLIQPSPTWLFLPLPLSFLPRLPSLPSTTYSTSETLTLQSSLLSPPQPSFSYLPWFQFLFYQTSSHFILTHLRHRSFPYPIFLHPSSSQYTSPHPSSPYFSSPHLSCSNCLALFHYFTCSNIGFIPGFRGWY